jgi:hypothetical protein
MGSLILALPGFVVLDLSRERLQLGRQSLCERFWGVLIERQLESTGEGFDCPCEGQNAPKDIAQMFLIGTSS